MEILKIINKSIRFVKGKAWELNKNLKPALLGTTQSIIKGVGAKQFKISFQLFNNSLKIAEVIFAANNHIKKRLLQSDPEVKDNFNNTLEQYKYLICGINTSLSADEAEFLFDNEQPGTCLIRKSVTNDYRLVICILEIGKVEQWIIDPILLTYGLSNILSKYKFIKLNETHQYETCKIEDLQTRFGFYCDTKIDIEISVDMSFTIRDYRGNTEITDKAGLSKYLPKKRTEQGKNAKYCVDKPSNKILEQLETEKQPNKKLKVETPISLVTIYRADESELGSFTVTDKTTFGELLDTITAGTGTEPSYQLYYKDNEGRQIAFVIGLFVVEFKEKKMYIRVKPALKI